MKRISILLGLALLAAPVFADDDFASELTYTRDVAPIMATHCVECHHPGEGAPMTLMNYEETRPWAKSIKKAVAEGEMPPWKANPEHGTFRNDISLTKKQIDTIVRWVDNGAPKGDPKDMPTMPEFTPGWRFGEPDYIIELDEVTIPAGDNSEDYFPNLNVKIDVPEARWVRAIEVRPGNLDVTHHVVLFKTGRGMMTGASFDALAVWAVGTPPVEYPEGQGRWVRPGENLMANMHYYRSETEQVDKTVVGLYFGEGPLEKEITTALAGSINFAIPPNTADHKIESSYFIDQDVKVVSYFPHMHMRGQKMKFTAHYPDGNSEVLLDVPEYDFNWQWFYYPENDVILPVDTRIDIEAYYDNTANNPNNPDPSKTLYFGESSEEEMMFGLFEFTSVEGVRPKKIPSSEKIKRRLKSHEVGSSYEIKLDMGRMKFDTGMHLPRDSDEGTIYFAFLTQVIPMPIEDVTWDGDNFKGRISMMGGRMGDFELTGSVDKDGNVTGDFAVLEPEKAAQRDHEDGRPDVSDFFSMQGFEGKLFVPADKEVSSR